VKRFGDLEVPTEGPGLVSVAVDDGKRLTASDLYLEHRRLGGVKIQFWEEILSRGLRPI
jgi:hypothetical protein